MYVFFSISFVIHCVKYPTIRGRPTSLNHPRVHILAVESLHVSNLKHALAPFILSPYCNYNQPSSPLPFLPINSKPKQPEPKNSITKPTKLKRSLISINIRRKVEKMLSVARGEYQTINFEETELCLGLPGGSGVPKDVKNSNAKSNGKRGFSETEGFDLKLNLSSLASSTSIPTSKKDVGVDQGEMMKEKAALAIPSGDNTKPPAKSQVVGWPPVRSFRKNIMTVQKPSAKEETEKSASGSNATNGVAFVKVSMDGAPYLRKVDLKMYKSYQELSHALTKMFSAFTIGKCESEGTKDFTSESKLIDLLNDSEYVPTYEDKDGDWMLVGDVPWEMFVGSCKRLRIMKGSEAIGLAPRAVEKCKSRS